LPHGLGYQRWFARRLGNRQQLGDAAARVGGQPASDGIPIDTQQLRHPPTGAGLLGLQEIKGLQALLLLGISLGMKELPQLLRRFADPGEWAFSWRSTPAKRDINTRRPIESSFYLLCVIFKGR
jgi:hypothetical protein